MSTDIDADLQTERVRRLPTDQRDMAPCAVVWAKTVLRAVRAVPRVQMHRQSRQSLTCGVDVGGRRGLRQRRLTRPVGPRPCARSRGG